MSYGIGQVPGIITGAAAAQSAFDYIKSKLSEFKRLGSKLHRKQMEAAAVALALRAKGKDDSEAMKLVREFSSLKLEWSDTQNKIDNLIGNVPGLGAIPAIALAAYGTVAVAIAAAMYAILRKSNAAEKALDAFERGQLTPSELKDVLREVPGDGGIFAGLQGAVTPLILGAIAIAVLPLLFKPTRQTW